jgi:hypothetical protein
VFRFIYDTYVDLKEVFGKAAVREVFVSLLSLKLVQFDPVTSDSIYGEVAALFGAVSVDELVKIPQIRAGVCGEVAVQYV